MNSFFCSKQPFLSHTYVMVTSITSYVIILACGVSFGGAQNYLEFTLFCSVFYLLFLAVLRSVFPPKIIVSRPKRLLFFFVGNKGVPTGLFFLILIHVEHVQFIISVAHDCGCFSAIFNCVVDSLFTVEDMITQRNKH